MVENRRIKCFTFIVFLIVCVEVFLNIGPSTEVFMQTGQLSKALSCPRTSFVKRRSTTHRKNWDIVALALFPGSGNTWVREMIQQGLGVWTGAVYKDPGLLHNGFIAEGQKDSSVIVVKTHYPLKGCFSKRYQEYRLCVGERDNVWKASGTLFVIRNPFDTILADFNHIASGRNHTGVAEESAFKVDKWENYVRKRAIKWNFHVGYYRHSVPSESIARVSTLPDIRSIGNLQYPPDDEQVEDSLRRNYIDGSGKPVRMIVFELLRHSFASEYQELLNALRELHHDTIQFPDVETATNCAKRPITEKFHRKSSKLLFNPFTEKQIAYLCEVTKDQWLPEVWGKCDGRLSWQRRL